MTTPYRWDLVTPDQLGSLLEGVAPPDTGFAPALAACAGQVLARSGHGDLVFVGRSLDSMFDILSGALSGIEGAPGIGRLPLSFARPWDQAAGERRRLTRAEVLRARALLESTAATPYRLVRRRRPVTFVDVVHEGGTFAELYELLREWIDEDGAQWDVARTKLRFVGVTSRQKTSPNAYRWAQDNPWVDELPSKAVINVSLDRRLWSYLGNYQPKLTRSFTPDRWLVDSGGPDRSERTRIALSEAVALVGFGRSAAGRRCIASAIDGEPALSEAWLRTLRSRLA